MTAFDAIVLSVVVFYFVFDRVYRLGKPWIERGPGTGGTL